MIKFPSIGQFRNVVKEVRLNHDYLGECAFYVHTTPYPEIEFEGTVKIHGTNAGVVKTKDKLEYQSRERVLSLTSDNSQFMLHMSGKNLDFLFNDIEFNDHIAVFGEWCGQGVQKGVAVSELPKMFIIFGYLVDGEWKETVRHDNSQSIYHVKQFPIYRLSIDFNDPGLSQDKLSEITEGVEKECPVGKYFNVQGTGEGVVWKATYNGKCYRFKVKGAKHSVYRSKKLAQAAPEQMEDISGFVDSALTENRLQQGVSYLKENNKELSQSSTGDFLRWTVNDIMREEGDTIISNQLDPKMIKRTISNKARTWYFSYLNELTHLK